MVGLENDMRARFFGPDASTAPTTERLIAHVRRLVPARSRSTSATPTGSTACSPNTRDSLELVIHTAAQPSHDWAASDPQTDFTVNANGTLNLLEATRRHAPAATVHLLLDQQGLRRPAQRAAAGRASAHGWSCPPITATTAGIDTTMSIDASTHSLFGVSKAAADLLVQEYGRYFDMPTVCFRGGCLTGPNHAGTMLHGFLSYLMRCTMTGEPYTVFGYDGKQVRDNIHSADLVAAFDAFHALRGLPRSTTSAAGARATARCSRRSTLCERIAGRELDWQLVDQNRIGDHRWWITDLEPFRATIRSGTSPTRSKTVLREIHERNAELWLAAR